MKRLSGLIVVGLVLGVVAGPAGAAPKPKLPKLTGGGQATNNNSGSVDHPQQVFQFGFNAQATGPGVVVDHPVFTPNVTVYPATGQFQARSYDANDPSTTVSQGHGQVVCVANFGPSSGVDGGGNPNGTVWEVRVAFEDPTFGTVYGSFLMQDNGRVDYIDESFSFPGYPLFPFDPRCGLANQYELESVTQGNIQAH